MILTPFDESRGVFSATALCAFVNRPDETLILSGGATSSPRRSTRIRLRLSAGSRPHGCVPGSSAPDLAAIRIQRQCISAIFPLRSAGPSHRRASCVRSAAAAGWESQSTHCIFSPEAAKAQPLGQKGAILPRHSLYISFVRWFREQSPCRAPEADYGFLLSPSPGGLTLSYSQRRELSVKPNRHRKSSGWTDELFLSFEQSGEVLNVAQILRLRLGRTCGNGR
jgi:hypothetical protein